LALKGEKQELESVDPRPLLERVGKLRAKL
jgi:hypothetical protein